MNKPKAPFSPNELIPLLDDDIEPPSENGLIEDEFVQALAAGDAATAAKALRKLDALYRPVPDLLADLFDGDPVLGALFPYRLKLVPRKRGKPPLDYLTKQGKEQSIARAVALALVKFGNLESAVNYVEHQQAKLFGKKTSRSTIIKCFTAHRKKTK